MLHTQLRSFHAVAKEGGFTAASEAIHVGQSTISTQIKALEDTYGVTLFHRPGRKVQISDCGEALFKISQRIIKLEEEARDLLNIIRARTTSSDKFKAAFFKDGNDIFRVKISIKKE